MQYINEYIFCLLYVIGLTTAVSLFLKVHKKGLLFLYVPMYAMINYMVTHTIAKSFLEMIVMNSIILILDFIYCCIITKKIKIYYLFYTSLYFILFGMIINFITYSRVFFGSLDIAIIHELLSQRAFVVIMTNVVTVLIVFIIKKTKFLPIEKHLQREQYLYIIVNCITFYVYLVIYTFSIELVFHNVIIMQVLLTVLWLVLLKVLYNHTITKIQNEELLYTNISNKYIDKYIEYYNSESIKLKKIQHDIKNHKLVLETIANNQHFKEYIDDIFEKNNSVTYINSGHIFIDSCLYVKQEEYQDIHFQYDIRISTLELNNKDITTILFNLIDNAVEEARKTDKKIRIVMCMQKEGLKITVINTCLSKPDFKTNKGNNHGYGMRIISSIVEKYQGTIFIDYRDTILNFNIVLNIRG